MSNDPAFYVEGVPVKISECFRPPRKVKLTSSCYYQVNTEVLTNEYDFMIENETLRWIEECKKFKKDAANRREESISNYEEEKKKKHAEDQIRLQKLKDEEVKRELQKIEEDERKKEELESKRVEDDMKCLDDEAGQADDEYVPDKKMQVNTRDADGSDDQHAEEVTDPAPTTAPSQQTYPTVLIPTQCSPNTLSNNSTANANANINFAEFEGDASDPFDIVALKSINDMEELAKVLQTSHIENSSSHNQYPPLRNPNEMYPTNSIYSPYQSYPHTDISQHPSYRPNMYQKYAPSCGDEATQPFQSSSYQHWENSVLHTHSNGQQPNQFPFSTGTSLSNTPVLPMTINSLHKTNTATEHSMMPSVLPKRQDLEDFYSRYYSNKKSSNVQSGQSTPTSNMFGSLRSSTSVPDLTAAEETELSHITSLSHKNHIYLKPSVSNPSSRPSSTVGLEALHNIPNNTDIVGSNVRLPDPFTELNSDAQTLVQSITEMGFPRPRVARTVQKLGSDHKKLLEVLLVLQSFQDSGEDEYRAERAFYFYMGEITKVKEFLVASKVLLDLGFGEETVVDHLFRHQNDKDKCLEELIS